MKNTHGGVLLLVKLQATKSNTHPWVLFMFLKLYKWYQIVQGITYADAAEFKKGLFCDQNALNYKGISV